LNISIFNIFLAKHLFDNERLFGWQSALSPIGRSGMHKIDIGRYRSDVMQVV